MRNTSEIIEDCKLNKPVDNAELRYSVIALTSLMNMAMSVLNGFYKENMKIFDKMRIENVRQAYKTVLNKSPKEWLGWNNDPENPDYQRFYAVGSKLVEKALRGELPNQKK
jgi:hypothetical protein